MKIPFHRPFIGDEEIAAVVDTLKSGWLTTGPKVKKFEQAFCEYTGAKHAIAVNSCTAALHLSLAGLDIGPGDAVITTPYTFVATAEAIQYVGARPVFVDIQESDFNIDPQKIEECLRSTFKNKELRPRVLMPVHMAGQVCDMNSIMEIAQKQNLHVVEDAAHCVEGWLENYNGKKAKIGTIGDATCFSFYATKNITSGEGGMLTTNNDELAEKVRILALHGMSRDAWKRYTAEGSWYYEIVAQGYKYNLTDIAAALGLVQLKKAEKMHAVREKYAKLLTQELRDLEEIILPSQSPNVRHAWHLFLLRLQLDKLKITRNEFIKKLQERGIQTSVHFIPLHLQPYFQKTFGFQKGDFPVAESVYESVISLPFFPSMTEDEVVYVAQCVKEITRNHTEIAVPAKV